MGWIVRLIVVLAYVAPAAAQLPAGVAVELQQMAAQAGVIFTGQVVSVSRNDPQGFVDIRFSIDDAIRGCPKTGFYVVREWAGLWSGQQERYRVGQRRLMLLTARNASGMSSPVGGMDGAIPLVATGAAPIANSAGVAPVDTGVDAPTPSVDLRWIQARVTRGSSSASATARLQPTGIPVKPWPDPASSDWNGPITALLSSSQAMPATLGSVLVLLGGAHAHR